MTPKELEEKIKSVGSEESLFEAFKHQNNNWHGWPFYPLNFSTRWMQTTYRGLM